MVKVTKQGEQVSPNLPPFKKRERQSYWTKEEKELAIQKINKLNEKNRRMLYLMSTYGINEQALKKISDSEKQLTIDELRYCLQLLRKDRQERKDKYIDSELYYRSRR